MDYVIHHHSLVLEKSDLTLPLNALIINHTCVLMVNVWVIRITVELYSHAHHLNQLDVQIKLVKQIKLNAQQN
jgi:HAMP domain-containing protein